jgi:type III pantothenate kinase
LQRTESATDLVDIGDVDLLAISMGNTRTRVGTFLGGRLVESAAFDNRDEAAIVERLEAVHGRLSDGTALILASVNPPLAERLNAESRSRLGTPLRRIETDVRVPLERTIDPGTNTGQDRLVDAVAAFAIARGACVVVDAGTAITVDLVDDDGTFRGGAIAPGARLMLGALHSRTAQLPEIEAARPERAAGRSTAEAMRSGIFHALRGIVSELRAAYGREIGRDLPIVATGGDAEWLFADAPGMEKIVPDLPLWGIALAWRAAGRTA